MNNNTAHILHGNPAPILIAGADLSAQPQAARQKHFSYGATMGTEHESGSKMYNAHAFSSGRASRSFPFATYFRKKAVPGWTFFAQDLTATVSVIANR